MPSSAASVARVEALVTPAALISTSAKLELQVVVTRCPTSSSTRAPELLGRQLPVHGQDLDDVVAIDVDELALRALDPVVGMAREGWAR